MESQLTRNIEFYLAYNQIRTKRLLDLAPPKKKPLFHVLSFLLHINNEEFPGYVKNDTAPCGIERFSFVEDLKPALMKTFPKHPLLQSDLNCLSPKVFYIKSLLLMGSLGSVAQTAKSDFDFWVCINKEDMNSGQLESLKEKLQLIEKWAEEKHGLEVHFFLTDITMVQKNNFGDIDKESAGTSQARLLKEEFYRTSILVAGKIPFWWLTPTGITDEEYTKYKEVAKQSPNLDTDQFIDLGNLNEITTGEFFGAALWQMNKAMDSPYKSVLKMALLEGFLDPEVKTQLLCNILKFRVHARMPDESNDKYIDPYVIMFDSILNYYKKKKRTDVIDLLATCFYIKSGVKATKATQQDKNLNFKERVIFDYVKSWEWNQNKLEYLNDFKEWDFEKVLSLGNQVHNFLIQTYRNLADKLKKESSTKQLISDQDITVLGRKLFSFYSQKPGKVQLLKRAFDEGLWQDSITFAAEPHKQHKIMWSAYRGQLAKHTLSTQQAKDKLLKQGRNIVNIIIWSIYNQLLDKKTSFYFIPDHSSPVSLVDIQELMNLTFSTFPLEKISSLKNDDLLTNSKKTKILIILNFASPRWVQAIETIAIIYLTTWGEFFCESHNAQEGKKIVFEYIKENPYEGMAGLREFFKIFIPKSQFSKQIYSSFNVEIMKKLGR